jgi:hypothetical protein
MMSRSERILKESLDRSCLSNDEKFAVGNYLGLFDGRERNMVELKELMPHLNAFEVLACRQAGLRKIRLLNR